MFYPNYINIISKYEILNYEILIYFKITYLENKLLHKT